MASVYCEVCGIEIKNIRDPQRLIKWNHTEARSLVGCFKHNRVSLYDKSLHRFNPLTGERKKAPNA